MVPSSWCDRAATLPAGSRPHSGSGDHGHALNRLGDNHCAGLAGVRSFGESVQHEDAAVRGSVAALVLGLDVLVEDREDAAFQRDDVLG